MPEGDTVWLAARRMHSALAGRELTQTDFRLPQLATADLRGRTVVAVASRGKHLLTRLDDARTLHTHFRMDGTWRLFRHGERWTGGPGHDIRVVLGNAEWDAVGYRLKDVAIVATAREPELVGHLGPDLLGDPGTDGGWDAAEALRRLSSSPDREIGPALLDQRNLAGIGNLYKTEALFLSGITPWTRVADMADLEGVIRRAHRLMQANKGHWSQTTTGNTHRGEEHWVFERAGRPCRRCGSPIRCAIQEESEHPERGRLSYWCATCQRGPAPA